jgi:ribose 5-phosphate isomerase B
MNKPNQMIIGCDHAAFPLKQTIKAYLEEKGFQVADVGTHDTASVNYADYGMAVASKISNGDYKWGILLCGTGLGMSMVANRYPHVRATLCNDLLSAIMSRRHNDSNILVLGGRLIGDVLALEILEAWLNTPFEKGRHQSRLDSFDTIT